MGSHAGPPDYPSALCPSNTSTLLSLRSRGGLAGVESSPSGLSRSPRSPGWAAGPPSAPDSDYNPVVWNCNWVVETGAQSFSGRGTRSKVGLRNNFLYYVKISRDGTLVATSLSPSYSDLNLVAGAPHTYTVSAFDGAGNTSDPSTSATATAASPPPPSVAYTYDLADRLTAITTASGQATTFTIDALGRHASRTVAANPIESYSYLGASNTVIGITSGSTTTTSAIDAVGNRVATGSGGAVGFLLPDLHGNTAGALNSTATAVTDAFAYDAYGNTVASVTSTLPTPWRYQGRILESAPGTPDLYDFGARNYNPTLGTFTSLDSTHGSAGNPALLNGYLYANANPATLVDPDGHMVPRDDGWYSAPPTYKGTPTPQGRNLVDLDTPPTNTSRTTPYGPPAPPQMLTLGSNGIGLMKGQDPHCDNIVCGLQNNVGGAVDTAGRVAVGKVQDLAGSVGNGWSSTGGQVVDYGIHHPMQVLAVATAAACLATTSPLDPICDGLLIGAAGGFGGYTLGHTDFGALAAGKAPIHDWNWDNAALSTVIGEAGGGVAGGLGGAFDAAMGSQAANYPSWSLNVWDVTVAGPLGGLTSLLLNHATGDPTPVDDMCNTVTSFISGKGGALSALCGLMH